MKPASSVQSQAASSEAAADAATTDAAATDAKSFTQYATVYTFYVYDHDQGKTVIYPRMATPAAIAKMRGKMNEETAWVVDATTLDVEGFLSR